MSSEQLNLRCPTCGSMNRPPTRSSMPWAAIEAYSHVDWLDEGAALPSHDIWPRSSKMPESGHRRRVKVYHPFAAVLGESFWVMFMPGAAALNGWATAPETIAASAFVHCRLDEIIRRAEPWAWVVVAVDDVVPIPELERRFPAQITHLPPVERHQTLVRTCFQDWDLIEGSSEGDVAVWFLAHRRQRKLHLVAAGHSSFHEDIACAGNLEITEEQWAGFCRSPAS